MRQNLLSQNKMSKYLLYATGEIVLVIIGILIALSISTNVENRKQQDEIKYFLSIIKSDISTVVIDAKGLKVYRDSSKFFSYKSLENINSNLELGIQDFDKVFSTNYNPNAGKKLVYIRSAFNALISSGLMTKIKNPNIQNALIDYYDVIGELEKWEVIFFDQLGYMNRELFLEVGTIEFYDYFSNPKLITEKHQIWFNNFISSHFLSAFHIGNLDDSRIYGGYSELIKKRRATH